MRNQHTITKALCLFTLAVVLSGTVFGCAYKYKGAGLRIGFEFAGRLERVMLAAESETAEFPADNVSMVFHYALEPLSVSSVTDEMRPVGYGVYFSSSAGWPALTSAVGNIDYKLIAGNVFLTEITPDEIQNGKYGMTQTGRGGRVFEHAEAHVIPEAFFIRPSGYVYFAVVSIFFSDETRLYYSGNDGLLTISYRFISDHEVKLSAA
ncbi:MAG: hypothetical protein LBM78_03720 [Clostridiales bacterium]|jgi:hypothetical protein|nr:hypothetical protein [Clostridiales bacterium]